uniref:Reverse transcriptase n=1 Tax=Erpetoichthys calabaricus TaxID=27687 RepID=A0A8C4XFF0_ERPCA
MESNTSNMDTMNILTINIPEDTYYCLVCGDMLASLQRLIKHYKIKHHEAKVIFKCLNCSKTSYNHHSIAYHQAKCKKSKTHMKMNCLTCPTCGDQFNSNRGLGQHIRHRHLESDTAITEDLEQSIIESNIEDDELALFISPLESEEVNIILPMLRQTLIIDNGLELNLAELWRENFENPTHKEIWLEDTTNLLLKELLSKTKDKKSEAPKHSLSSKKQVPKRILKKYCYKRAQTLYTRNRAHLASEILDGLTRKKCEILLNKIYEHFNGSTGLTQPITIGSLITRILSKILYTSLKSGILLNPRQRGFMETAGCSENIQTLQAIIMAHKAHQKSFGMVFIDFEKVFDTISHAYLFRILRIMRLDTHISQLFRDMYSGASTCVENSEGNTNDITLMRGVKQGDALFPLFFNISIDPLIHKLEMDGSGTILGEATITAMAFADDLVLVSNTWGGMKKNLNILKEFCRGSGLKLQPAKCKGFFFTWKNQSLDGIYENLILQETCNQNKICGQMNNLWKLKGGIPNNFPNQDILSNICNNQLPNDVPIKFRDWRQAEIESWKKLSIQGLGIDLFEDDKVSNCWLYSHNWMSQGQFIATIHVRANVFPTRETTSRGRQEPSHCRKCIIATESLSHILGQCPALQKERITRHHKLCNLLAKECEAHRWIVHTEQSIKLNSGRSLRPDLILIKDKDGIVIDLTVRFEFNLEEAQRVKFSKEQKYGSMSSYIREIYGTNNVQTFGIVIGARGKWYEFNNKPLKQIGLSASRTLSFSKLMSRRGLLYSLDMLTAFSK